MKMEMRMIVKMKVNGNENGNKIEYHSGFGNGDRSD